MPTYDFYCVGCGFEGTRVVPVAKRDTILCPECPEPPLPLKRRLSCALFKFAGRVTPGGGPDRFTADMLDIPLKELPTELKV